MWDVTGGLKGGFATLTFLLTHPVWDVTDNALVHSPNSIFLLTHPVWDVTHSPVLALCLLLISTHTSRVGCDSSV